MKTFSSTICLALVIVLNIMAGVAWAGVDCTLGTVSGSVDMSIEPVVDINNGSEILSCVSPDQMCQREHSYSIGTISDIMGQITAIKTEFPVFVCSSDVVVVSDPSLRNVAVSLTAGSGSVSLLMAGLISFAFIANIRRIYASVLEALSCAYQTMVLFPAVIRGFHSGEVSRQDSDVAFAPVFANEIVSGRDSLTIGFAGMLRKLAGSYFFTQNFAFSNLYCTLAKAQQVLVSVCALLFALVLVPARVTTRFFWEDETAHRCVYRYLVMWPGRVRLAAVCSGSYLLDKNKSKPDFYRSFAMCLPVSSAGHFLIRREDSGFRRTG